MKYHYEVNDSANSHGKILAHIPHGCEVLECGCATGYMTRYLRDALACSVSIIECEREAFEIARQYAADGLCCDLMREEWCDYFKGKKFDAIIFADVLEHLTSPEKVLCEAAKLLKDDGIVLVSIPNIAHNDIIIKLLHNRWDYTNTGLLDDTHVHFWGANNLSALAESAGLQMTCLEGVEVPTFTTEQLVERRFSEVEYKLLQSRPYGEVYQFILALRKKSYAKKNRIAFSNKLPERQGFSLLYDTDKLKVATLYYTDTPGEYENADRVTVSYAPNYRFRVSMEVRLPDEVREIRIDPAEEDCLISCYQVCCDGISLPCKIANADVCEGMLLFGVQDPQMIFSVPPGCGRTIRAEWSMCFDRCLQKRLVCQLNHLRAIGQHERELEAACDAHEERIEALADANRALAHEIKMNGEDIAKKNILIDEKNAEVQALTRDAERLTGELERLQARYNKMSNTPLGRIIRYFQREG